MLFLSVSEVPILCSKPCLLANSTASSTGLKCKNFVVFRFASGLRRSCLFSAGASAPPSVHGLAVWLAAKLYPATEGVYLHSTEASIQPPVHALILSRYGHSPCAALVYPATEGHLSPPSSSRGSLLQTILNCLLLAPPTRGSRVQTVQPWILASRARMTS